MDDHKGEQVPENIMGKELLDLAEGSETQQKWEILEERLRAIEEIDVYRTLNARDLCLVQDIIIPPKFKIPEFDKYDGTNCPRSHLIMYCRKMVMCINDDKLLIYFFHNSLIGASARWYMQLNRSHVRSWKQLANAFINQYRYNIDMAPDRMDLQNMEKKSSETFKQYAQRWRVIAVQVNPPLSDKEMVAIFINTLCSPYYDRMIGSASTNFADVVIIGERIEIGVKRGRITDDSVGASRLGKEVEVQEVAYYGQQTMRTHYNNSPQQKHTPVIPQQSYNPYQPFYSYVNSSQSPYPHHYLCQPTYQHASYPPTFVPQPASQLNNQKKTPRISGRERKLMQYDSIPMTYTELLPRLIQNGQITHVPSKPMRPPYPRWYDPNAMCAYHSGVVGHSTENCLPLRHRIQILINAGQLNFNEMMDAPDMEET